MRDRGAPAPPGIAAARARPGQQLSASTERWALVVAELGAHGVDRARELVALRLLDALGDTLRRARLLGVRGEG
jgi:hypothetical protein